MIYLIAGRLVGRGRAVSEDRDDRITNSPRGWGAVSDALEKPFLRSEGHHGGFEPKPGSGSVPSGADRRGSRGSPKASVFARFAGRLRVLPVSARIKARAHALTNVATGCGQPRVSIVHDMGMPTARHPDTAPQLCVNLTPDNCGNSPSAMPSRVRPHRARVRQRMLRYPPGR
ncbi:MAG: hypothetical protein CM15mP74_06510 [Halieaceae bacterium]|nr:MAG: hypothetical protein CM15mP74_06510 [Halieaceae bacterium]